MGCRVPYEKPIFLLQESMLKQAQKPLQTGFRCPDTFYAWRQRLVSREVKREEEKQRHKSKNNQSRSKYFISCHASYPMRPQRTAQIKAKTERYPSPIYPTPNRFPYLG